MKKPATLIMDHDAVACCLDSGHGMSAVVRVRAQFITLAELDTLIAYLRDEARPWLAEQEAKTTPPHEAAGEESK